MFRIPPLPSPSALPDRLIAVLDDALRTLTAPPPAARPNPAAPLPESKLSTAEKRASAALLRVNHAGEIAAQALYTGQSLVSRSAATREHLLSAAREERDHLSWCAERIDELGGHTSRLAPFWYAGSVCIGAAAGVAGDRVSLGFVAETERQVEAHIRDHLGRLPAADDRSRVILEAMAVDEAHHGTTARLAGGMDLPLPARFAMRMGGEILRRIALIL